MTSEKWFDWDTSDSPEAGAPAPAASTDTPAQPVDSPRPESASVLDSAPGDFAPFESIDAAPAEVPEAEGLSAQTAPARGGSAAFLEENLPAEPAMSVEAALPAGDALPVATEEQAEPRTATALRALNVRPQSTALADAARPFHLWITGGLRSFEKERLTELLARENFGIREVDLELQLEAGKILLPRISEYAAVLVAQALRGASVELRLEPSELAANNQPGSDRDSYPVSQPAAVSRTSPEPLHPADDLPVTAEAAIPGRLECETLDVLIATGLIREPEWRAETSDAYAEMIESLKRELRFKAHLKKADALVRFETRILASPWISESECRIQVSALAIRFR